MTANSGFDHEERRETADCYNVWSRFCSEQLVLNGLNVGPLVINSSHINEKMQNALDGIVKGRYVQLLEDPPELQEREVPGTTDKVIKKKLKKTKQIRESMQPPLDDRSENTGNGLTNSVPQLASYLCSPDAH